MNNKNGQQKFAAFSLLNRISAKLYGYSQKGYKQLSQNEIVQVRAGLKMFVESKEGKRENEKAES